MEIFAAQRKLDLRKLDFDQALDRGTRLLALILVAAVIGFGLFYYTDRRVPAAPSMVDQTIVDLEELVRQSPNDPNLRVQVALAYIERGWIDSAIDQYQVAIELSPSHNAALIGLGNAFLVKDDYDSALVFFERVIDLNKDNPFRKTLRQLQAVYYRVGLIQERNGDYAAAEQSLREALGIELTDADAWFALGETLRKQDKMHEALDAYQKAVALDPMFTAAYEGLGQIFAQQGQSGLMDYAKGMVALSGGDHLGAIPSLERATAAAPEFADAFLGLGLAYEKAGRVDEAASALSNAVSLAPDSFLAEVSLQRVRDQQLKSGVK